MTQSPLSQDLSRGFSCRCLRCGIGKLFGKWLQVVDRCEACGEEYHHHRADDFPAYIVVTIVGHVTVGLAILLEGMFAPPVWLHLAASIPLSILLSVILLQPIKGVIVAIQWRAGMHGFKNKMPVKTEN